MKKPLHIVAILLLCAGILSGNTPGKHTITLTWTASTTSGVTYNLYRGLATGVCSGIQTPYVTGITTTSYLDTNVTNGTTYYYNVSAVGNGGESTCDGEVQIAVPNITTTPASNLSGTVN